MAKVLESTFPREDRVRRHSSRESLKRIDTATSKRVRDTSARGEPAISKRISELEREWDIERFLEMNASILALSGVVLGRAVSQKWLLLSGAVLAFLLQHALQGWCPPVPVFRHLGIRTRQEIDRERFALKAVRGDLDVFRNSRHVETSPPSGPPG